MISPNPKLHELEKTRIYGLFYQSIPEIEKR